MGEEYWGGGDGKGKGREMIAVVTVVGGWGQEGSDYEIVLPFFSTYIISGCDEI